MVAINMTQVCKENGIDEFSRTRGGWMKLVEGFDSTQKGGYCFVGSNFVKVGNYDADLENGLYIDCSKPVIDGEKQEIMNLFKIEDGGVELIKTIPKSQEDWALEFEDDVRGYFTDENVNAQEIINVIRDMTHNKEIHHEVALQLLKDEMSKVWLNENHFKAFMQEAGIYNANSLIRKQSVQEMAVKLFRNDFEAEKYFHYEINDDHQLRILYSIIQTTPYLRDYKDYEVVVETIPEDYYTNMCNLKELEKFNHNLLPLTSGKALRNEGYWFSFNGRFATTKTIYIVVANVGQKLLKIQRFELQL